MEGLVALAMVSIHVTWMDGQEPFGLHPAGKGWLDDVRRTWEGRDVHLSHPDGWTHHNRTND